MTPIPKAKWSHFLWMKVVIWQKSWNVFAFAPVAGYFNSTRTQQDSESCKLITYLGPCACKSHRSCPTLYPLESKIACQSSLPADKKGISCWKRNKNKKSQHPRSFPEQLLPHGTDFRCCLFSEKECGAAVPAFRSLIVTWFCHSCSTLSIAAF